MTNKCTIILHRDQQMHNYFALLPTNAQLFCTVTNKCTIISKLSQCYMFRHYRDILRELVIDALPSYAGMSNVVAGNTI